MATRKRKAVDSDRLRTRRLHEDETVIRAALTGSQPVTEHVMSAMMRQVADHVYLANRSNLKAAINFALLKPTIQSLIPPLEKRADYHFRKAGKNSAMTRYHTTQAIKQQHEMLDTYRQVEAADEDVIRHINAARAILYAGVSFLEKVARLAARRGMEIVRPRINTEPARTLGFGSMESVEVLNVYSGRLMAADQLQASRHVPVSERLSNLTTCPALSEVSEQLRALTMDSITFMPLDASALHGQL